MRQYQLDESVGPLFDRRSGVVEAVIPPRSALAGESVFPGMVTESGDLVILAVHREGEDLGPAKTVLAPGDTLLLQGTRDALATNLQVPEVLVVDAPEVVRRQAVPFGPGARRATVIVTSSGAADKLADRLVDIVGDAGPYPLLIGVSS